MICAYFLLDDGTDMLSFAKWFGRLNKICIWKVGNILSMNLSYRLNDDADEKQVASIK